MVRHSQIAWYNMYKVPVVLQNLDFINLGKRKSDNREENFLICLLGLEENVRENCRVKEVPQIREDFFVYLQKVCTLFEGVWKHWNRLGTVFAVFEFETHFDKWTLF